MTPIDDEKRALLALMLTPGLGPTLVGRCVDAIGSATATLHASAARLGAIRGISPGRSGELKRRIDAAATGEEVKRELDAVEAAGVSLIARDEADYPASLRHIPDPPMLLWVRGELRAGDALAVGVVGSRKCSHYGREQADRFAAGCATAGLCVVSGGAYGIDVAAHRAALRVGGRTVAVIGSGLSKPYPKDHVPVFERIVDSGAGAVVSELPMSIGPKPENFPRRNRIISGLALGVLVVEAAKRSGALITARLCVEEHGRECMAVPGRVDTPAAAGCHHILREGWASLVTAPREVLDQLGEAGRLLKEDLAPPEEAPTPLFDATATDTQKRLVAALDEPKTLDDLVAALGGSAGAVQADLTLLEIRGAVQRQAGRFVRRRGNGL
ncbi:MAG: DNA-processing protein DprA [Planctomycetota bacterium]